MNNKIRMEHHTELKGFKTRAPGPVSLTGPPAREQEVRRQIFCKENSEISNYLEESVKKFNLLLNKKHNLVDTSPDKPKKGFVRDSSCRTFPFGGIEE